MKRLIFFGIVSLIFVSCNKDNNSPSDKRLMQIANSAYSNDRNYITYGGAGISDVVWQDSVIVSVQGNTIEQNGDTMSIYDIYHNLLCRAFLENGKVVRVNNGSMYEGNPLAYWYTFSYSQSGEIESIERMCTACVPTTTTLTWENGNLMQMHEECLFDWNSSGNTYTKDETYRYYSYDNMNTPWQGLEQYFLILNPENPALISKNNITKVCTINIRHYGYDLGENRSESNTCDTVYKTYHYTYRDGYPIMKEVEENIDGFYHRDKEYYIYKDGTSANVPHFYTISVIPQSPENVDACGRLEQGGGVYEYGATAIMNTCNCRSVKWSDGSTENPHSIVVTKNATYTAVFTDNSQ